MSAIKKMATFSVVLLSMFLFVGCGGDEATIKKTAENFFGAMKDGDLDKMGSFMCKSAKADFEKSFNTGNAEQDKMAKDMAVGMMQAMMKDATVTFGKVTIDGDKATIESTAKMAGKEKAETDELEFVKEDGKWLVAKM